MPSTPPRAFVIGHPISHSRSPGIHRHWLELHGIAGSYEAIDVAPQALASFLSGMETGGFVGGNVTIPHKEAALARLAWIDPAAKEIGAANTLWIENGLLHGSNTDAQGFCANLDEQAPGWSENGAAVVLGAGGAARAIIHALKSRGVRDIRVANRTPERAIELADRFGPAVSAHDLRAVPELLADAGLLVNTSAAGMAGESELALGLDPLPSRAVVTDIVYVPLETPLLAAARSRGLKAVDGLGMLLHQAAPGFERWFGRRPEVTAELRALIVADLARF